MIFSSLAISSVSAYNLNDTDVNSLNIDNSEITLVKAANDATINIEVKDSYSVGNGTWVEDGVATDKAIVTIFDSSNKKVFEGTTNSKGLLSVNLAKGNYKVNINLETYETYSKDIVLSNKVNINHIFYPDILFFVDYTSHHDKVNKLLELSKRVCYVSTTNYDKSKEWLFEHANFIQLDMYTDGPTYSFNTDILKDSPAYKNYKIAYTFGVYSDDLLKSIDLHFVGGSPSNNNVNSIENTYIGSYFQAEDTPEQSVLDKNMANLLDYIKYLINPAKYSNPTLDSTRTPLLASTFGFYHPDLGTLTVTPSQTEINSWILYNPGYNHDGVGSLNWMSENFTEWQKVNLDPAKYMETFEKWYKQNKPHDNSFIAIASYYAGGELIDSLIRKYEAAGRPAFNIYQSGISPAMSSILVDIAKSSTIGISSVNSLYSWSLDYGGMANGTAVDDLSELDLTILKVVNDISQQGYDNELGPQMEWTYAVTIPSFEGVFGAIVTSYVDDLGKVHLIESGVDKLVKMTLGWANLKDKANADKNIAIVLYNYPPGKAEIGASYLDVYQSVHDLLELLVDNGYDIGMTKEEIPDIKKLGDIIANFGNKGTWAQGLLNNYVEENWNSLMANNQLISLDQYYELTSTINPNAMMQLVDYWGDGLGKIMVYNNTYIVIPGIQLGNVFITFQPSRGWEEVANYHDTTLPPHQQYVAFYEWLDKTAKTDVIINMGTHGTLEFLPGHQIGVQEGDWTFELTLTPTIYPYIVSNPGEAMVARDRLGALMITHMTPAIVSSELYGNYTNLANAINGYKNAVKLNVSDNAENYKAEIILLAKKLGFGTQGKDQTFDQWLDELHKYLDDMENDFNPFGLHTLGHVLSGENLVEEVKTIVTSQTNVYDHILSYLFPELAGLRYYDDIRGNEKYQIQDALIKSFLYTMVSSIVNETTCDDLAGLLGYGKNSQLYNDSLYMAEVILNIYANNEWNALLTALNGGYIEGGLFADPAYSNSIPTGYNGYATDHTKVPSKASFESAKKIVDLLLVNYYEEHGEWPELTALILWGTEISRTEGIGISEFLYFLGCKPTWTRTGTVDGVELIPLEDLKVTLSNGTVVNRPRIDVYASMVTSNINWITWLVTATRLAYEAPGESTSVNFVKKHYAENPTLNRLFGLPGNVLEGTGMSNFVPNTANWDINTVNEVLADIYLNKVSYAWTIDDNGKIVISQEKDDYKFLLSKTNLITQNLDSTWRVLDSDDYYDWFGGLKNAATQLGANPDTAFVDIRNKNNYVSRSDTEQIEFEIRSFLTNKKFLDEWAKSDMGMNAFASKVQNLFGYLVTSGGSINNELGNLLADAMLYINQHASSTTSAAASSSSSAWGIYMALDNKWVMVDENGNQINNKFTEFLNSNSLTPQEVADFLNSLNEETRKKLEDLANDMIQNAVDFGVACCHHTCKNINFNEIVMQVSTLSSEAKQKYADILANATLMDIKYESNVDTNEDPNNSMDDEDSVIVNGTSTENNGEAAAASPVGDSPATGTTGGHGGSGTSATSKSQTDNGKSGETQEAYEINKNVNKKAASGESSTPAVVVIAVIVLIILFGVGYIKNREDD
ncbi:MAG: cobaltochelatase subunit CobN [Methanobrevibacter sp.]|uniref:cobaltochelatase subunit CobN n=1 Tax=Methanobrevibacter sp. TaxID=66852 RepID=UPI0026E04C01|nr:cobaltochelatase subunit CobN [Methanobrevibacter sp.]MDO5848036.1 cobaltochelatase subunit CobN [Methanobrevibacter sp.]